MSLEVPQCLRCNSSKVWRNGHAKGVQRYLCSNCGYEFTDLQVERHVLRKSVKSFDPVLNLPKSNGRLSIQDRTKDSPLPFSEDVCPQFPSNVSIVGKSLNGLRSYGRHVRVSARERRVKNLDSYKEIQKTVAKAEDATLADIKGKIVEFAWHMKREGLKDTTIEPRIRLLKVLVKRGVNLLDPESVKDGIARQETWCEGRKESAVSVYTSFLEMLGLKWDPPTYKRIKKLPFIPTENELDQLIAGCGRKTATFLQMLKETGARCGEVWGLRWTDIDFQNGIVTITPEKGSEPRQFKVSGKLIAMLNALPREDVRIWKAKLKTIQRTYQYARARIAEVTKNPRLRRISFHTFRHWKATMEYHKTKDILHVMRMLGHRNINNTLKYTQLIKTEDDEFISKVAKTVEEACALVELGYEYVTEFKQEGIKIFRKRK